jgi:hypothetical protein
VSDEAISYVTKAIRALLLSRLLPNGLVTLLPPGEDPPTVGSGVNLYLYRVNESAFLKNQPWPGDRSGAAPSPSPALSLELFYLMTPFAPIPPGTDEDMGHRMLGAAMLVLHQNPVLNRAHIPGFDADSLPAALLDSFEDIKIRLHPVSIDELSKIWSTIGKPYRLSVSYEVTLVQVTPTLPPRGSAAAVQSTGLEVITVDPPRLTSLVPASGPLATLVGTTITPAPLEIHGFGFLRRGQQPVVNVGDTRATLTGTPAATLLTVVLPGRLAAGPDVDVRVSLLGRASHPQTFTVSPWMSSLSPLRTPLATAGLVLTIQGRGFDNPATIRADRADGLTWSSPILAGATPTTVTFTPPVGSQANATATGANPGNGFYDLRVVLANGRLSNPRTLEVIPIVKPSAGPGTPSTYDPATRNLTLNGLRLDGTALRLTIDGTDHVLAANANGTRLVHPLGRALAVGPHRVSLSVDGHVSHEALVTV